MTVLPLPAVVQDAASGQIRNRRSHVWFRSHIGRMQDFTKGTSLFGGGRSLLLGFVCMQGSTVMRKRTHGHQQPDGNGQGQ